jgi:hypothetical protein
VDAMMGGMEGGREMNNPYGNAYGNIPYGAAAQPAASRGGALQTIIDEKKLKVIMLLDFIKITPAQGR